MSTDRDQRQVPVVYKRTGEVRMADPTPSGTPRSATAEDSKRHHQAIKSSPFIEPQVNEAQGKAEGAMRGKSDAGRGDQRLDATANGHGSDKKKDEIATLERFIQHAYSRKGQAVSIKAKAEREIANNARLDDSAMARLLALADRDTLLAVPRQLLLVARGVKGLLSLRGALVSFVSTVMLRHRAYTNPGAQAIMRHQPDAPPVVETLAVIAAYTPQPADSQSLKPAELGSLRRNAVLLLATWYAVDRSLGADELASMLIQAVWMPAARELKDDAARFRALTEVDSESVMGFACARLRDEAAVARDARDKAQRESAGLREEVAALEQLRLQAVVERDELALELQAQRETTQMELAELRQKHETERMRLRHALDDLRGRLVKHLEENLNLLDTGLAALRSKTPRVEVMIERAELTTDSMRAQVANLQGK